MAIHDILVHVPGHHQWSPHVRYAARLSARLSARLTGVYAVEQPYSVAELQNTQLIAGALVAQLERQWAEAELAGPRFAELASEAGVPRSEWLVGQGDPTAILTYAAASRDIVVFGSVPGSLHASPALAARVAIGSGQPCLIVPAAADASEPRFDTIAIAWTGALEAVRAVHGALPLLARAERIVVLQGAGRDYSSAMRGLPLLELEPYLAAHRITAPREHVDSGPESGVALADKALAAGAGLLVMGAYGRTRFSEWVLGGATRHALWEGRVPLLMRH